MTDDITTELFDEEDDGSSCWVVEEPITRDLNSLLETLQMAKGSGFVWTLKEIALHSLKRIQML